MSLTPLEAVFGGPSYLIPYSATITAIPTAGTATNIVTGTALTVSLWVYHDTVWKHVLIQRNTLNEVYTDVNNTGTLTYQYTNTNTTYNLLIRNVLNTLFGSWARPWAELLCVYGTYTAPDFVSGTGATCRPKDPAWLTFASPPDTYLNFADPDATGQIPKSDGFAEGDVSTNTTSATTCSLLHPIPNGTTVTALSWYVLGGYATTAAKLGIWKKTGTPTGGVACGTYVHVVPFSLQNTTGWQTVATSYTVPDDGYEYYPCCYTDRRAYVTTIGGQGLYVNADAMTLNASVVPTTASWRSTILKWDGHKAAGLGQDVSGNGNHWDIDATQSTATPTS